MIALKPIKSYEEAEAVRVAAQIHMKMLDRPDIRTKPMDLLQLQTITSSPQENS